MFQKSVADESVTRLSMSACISLQQGTWYCVANLLMQLQMKYVVNESVHLHVHVNLLSTVPETFVAYQIH